MRLVVVLAVIFAHSAREGPYIAVASEKYHLFVERGDTVDAVRAGMGRCKDIKAQEEEESQIAGIEPFVEINRLNVDKYIEHFCAAKLYTYRVIDYSLILGQEKAP